MTDTTYCINTLLQEAVSLGWSRSQKQLKFRLGQLFEGVELGGKAILDIGGGTGVATLYAACQGARPAICLEPEGAGSRPDRTARFTELAKQLGVSEAAHLHRQTFQEYDPGPQKFDVILMKSSLHHLDERACTKVHYDPEAQQVYLGLLRKCFDLMSSGGWLIINDQSRHNLFPLIGMRNPFRPTMNWDLHPPPDVWIRLLKQAGFQPYNLKWIFFQRAGSFGQRLFGNRFGAFLSSASYDLILRRVS